MKDVVFVTGNPEKAENFSKHMGESIAHEAVELDEIQTLDAEKLVSRKAQQAYGKIKRPVLVEDVSFVFHAWGDLPGPFIKFFVDADHGIEKMITMIEKFEDRSATATCLYAYFDGATMSLFEGHIDGSIATIARGTNGYGFDRIFEPDGFAGKTAAELEDAEYDDYYSTIKPFDHVKDFLQTL